MTTIRVQTGLLILAGLLFVPFALRVDRWPGLAEPGGLFAWMPVIAFAPTLASLALGISLRRRTPPRSPVAQGGRAVRWLGRTVRWAYVTIAIVSLAVLALSEFYSWDWERRGRPTAMVNLEMIPVIFGLFVGWIGFGVAGALALMTAVAAWLGLINQRRRLTGDPRGR